MATTTLEQNLADLTTRISTEMKLLHTFINGNAADLSGLTTTAKSNLVAALNELKAAIAGASGINDAALSTSTSYSSQKTVDTITAAIAAVVDGAPTALNTLKELADKLASDDTALSAILTSLDNRVRVDAAQTFTDAQKTQGRANIGAQDAAAIGDPTRDLVAIFNAGLV